MYYYCEKCNYSCNKTSNWNKHIATKKHNSENTEASFICNMCKYKCNSSYDMDRHKQSNKHKNQYNTTESINKGTDDNDTGLMDIIKQLLTQNNELKNFIVEQAQEHKKETTDILNRVIDQANENKKDTLDIVNKVIENVKPTTITNTTNSNNKAFNINVFLNETCKDAINFSDFIKQLEVSREDLENNAQLGFVDGVSKILIDSLKQLDKTERPIHCTDVKRETMYIKDDDKWNKEEDTTKLNKAIQEVTRKSMGTLMNWKEENPDYKDRDSDFSDRCITIQKNSMAGYDRETYYPKVIKAVAKEVIVDK
jgi:hypothetical protein